MNCTHNVRTLSTLQETPPFFPPQKDLQNDPYFLIQGNNSSAPHKQGDYGRFDEFNPDYSSSAFSDRLSRYAKAHSRAVEMANYVRSIPLFSPADQVIPIQLQECGSFLLFHHYHTINEIRLAAMCSCHRHLLCPLCAIRRAAKSVKVYLDKFRMIIDESPRLKPYLVTLTVKDGSDLNERFEHLQKSLRKMYDHRRKSLNGTKRAYPNQACKAFGGVGSYEVKIGTGSGVWHPHAHFVWLCEETPDTFELCKEWLKITGDSFMCDVTPFDEGKDVEEAFLEVFKYALKYSNMSLEDNWEAFQVLRRRRLVSSFGSFYGLEIPEQLTDEITFEELPYIELIYRYINNGYQHVRTNFPNPSDP